MNNTIKIVIIGIVILASFIMIIQSHVEKEEISNPQGSTFDAPLFQCENYSQLDFRNYWKNLDGIKAFSDNTRDSDRGSTFHGDISKNPRVTTILASGQNYSAALTVTYGSCPGDLINMTMNWNDQKIDGQENIISFFNKE